MNLPALAVLWPFTARRILAVGRLLLLYALLCGLLLLGGVQHRADVAAGHSLWRTPDPVPTGLPFAGVTVDPAAYAPEERAAALAELAGAGFGFARVRLDWGEMEPQPGVYAWETAGAWIDAITAAQLVPLVVLDGSPAWARAPQDRSPTDNPLAPPADPSDLARFAAAFAARYGERVRFYQVWDEPNIAPHWGSRLIEPVAYAQLLAAAAAAIRTADPDAVIAAAALAPTTDRGHTAVDEVYFWQRMVAAGAGAAFDAVAIEPFGFGAAPIIGAQASSPARWGIGQAGTPARQSLAVLNFQRAVLLRRALVDMGLGDKAVWAVRSGWNRLPNTLWGTVTAQDQAAYAVGAYEAAWGGWPWLEALGWAIDRPHAPTADPVWGFALHAPDGAPAPVLAALGGWLATVRGEVRPQPPGGSWGEWLLPWLLMGGGLALVGWRSVAAARLLPWEGWIGGWRRLPWAVQSLAWAGLLWLYHIAVWPPLIGLSLILGALLCLTQPQVGLALAALLLPFYYQHKELPLVDAVITIPPATAALLCLLPALIRAARRRRPQWAAVDAAVAALAGISLLSAARVWQWPAYGGGLVDLVLVPLGLWLAVRILYGGEAAQGGDLARPHPQRTRYESEQVAGAARGAKDRYLIALALFGGGVLAAGWGLLAWLGGQGVAVDGVLRLVGPHFSPNHTALYLLRTAFLGAGLAGGSWAVARQRTRSARRRAGYAVEEHGHGAASCAGVPAAPARGRAGYSLHHPLTRSLHHPLTRSPAHPLTRSPAHPLILWAATALVLAALVLTGSRGALLLGLPVGALVLGFVALRRQPGLLRWLRTHPTARWLAAASLLLAGTAAVLLWDRLLNRQTLSLRIDLWEASLRLWRDYLLLGVGPGGFVWSYPAYLPLGGAGEPNQLHPHNVWLEVATTWGLLGFAWLGLLGWQLAALWQRRRRLGTADAWLSAGLLAGLLAAFAHAQMDAFFLLPDLAGWNLLALAVAACLHEGVRG